MGKGDCQKINTLMFVCLLGQPLRLIMRGGDAMAYRNQERKIIVLVKH